MARRWLGRHSPSSERQAEKSGACADRQALLTHERRCAGRAFTMRRRHSAASTTTTARGKRFRRWAIQGVLTTGGHATLASSQPNIASCAWLAAAIAIMRAFARLIVIFRAAHAHRRANAGSAKPRLEAAGRVSPRHADECLGKYDV